MDLNRRVVFAASAAIISIACVGALARQAPPPAEAADSSVVERGSQAGMPVMDKRALDILKLMSDTVSKAKTVSFQARSMVPMKMPDGLWINMYGTSRVVMQGADKLFAGTAGDFAPFDFYFDGKTVTRFSPDKNMYSVKEEPGTIDDLVESAYREDGRSFPYANILISEPYAAMTDGLISAVYVGQSTIMPLSGHGSVKTDHLVFSNSGVQWQIWIDAGDHLPRLVCATYLDDRSEPSYTVEFGDWKINEPVAADAFIYKNVSDAVKVEFRSPMQLGRKVSGPEALAKLAQGGRS